MVRPSYHEKWLGNKPHSAAHPANIEPPKMSELLKKMPESIVALQYSTLLAEWPHKQCGTVMGKTIF